jgi:hypothetical protein
MPATPVICPYCHAPAEKVTGDILYAHRNDMGAKTFWRCIPCATWVGCHLGTDVPLGRLANAELRTWKRRAHEVFDPLWRVDHSKKKKAAARSRAYEALAHILGISAAQCHIGEFDVDLCKRTVAAIPQLRQDLESVKMSP